MTLQRLNIEIHGAVQGVGFRPYVYRLAIELNLSGWVINDTRGVFIEVEGLTATLNTFLARLPAEKPPRALIHSLESTWMAPLGETEFTIRHSDAHGAKTALILPDIATCADCLAETLDPTDRRYAYPFTNCTNCGPRFTIIEALPYDRPNTTMRSFIFCPQCQAEYTDPRERRFHAQPNACPSCGPQVELWVPVNTDQRREVLSSGAEALRQAAIAIMAGQIVAVKGLGGFHLMADARNAATIARLRERKRRYAKPFALMACDMAQIRAICELSPQVEALLNTPEAPIILLPRRSTDDSLLDASLADNIAPGNPNLGVMLPATPLHHVLLRQLSGPIVATSGNLSDEPICTDEDEALVRLGRIADRFLVHNRPIARHSDDSVVWIIRGEAQLLRRARGYAPLPIVSARAVPTILAVGAHLKNTVALSVGNRVFISQHIGDLETPEALNAFECVIADFLRLYEVSPIAIAHDMHPDYLSTHWAQRQGAALLSRTTAGNGALISSQPLLIPVQHHHAHLAACLAEHNASGPALGVIWDGTGYGPDGMIWGGEFLLGDARHYRRIACFHPFRLPGGAAAIKEPRRVALALLWELYGAAILERDDLPSLRTLQPLERRLLVQMLERNVQAPRTSSAGRLFDGIAALLGLHQQVSFEGQAAMALEFAADPTVTTAYPLEFRAPDVRLTSEPAVEQILDWRPTVAALLDDLQRGVDCARIAGRFHQTLVDAVTHIALSVGEQRVVLSGGCFQNRLLTERCVQQLEQVGFEVLAHRQVPPNDGGISLGQIAVAAAQFNPSCSEHHVQ